MGIRSASRSVEEVAREIDGEIDAAQQVGYIEHEIDLSQTALSGLFQKLGSLFGDFEAPTGIITIRSRIPSALLKEKKAQALTDEIESA